MLERVQLGLRECVSACVSEYVIHVGFRLVLDCFLYNRLLTSADEQLRVKPLLLKTLTDIDLSITDFHCRHLILTCDITQHYNTKRKIKQIK